MARAFILNATRDAIKTNDHVGGPTVLTLPAESPTGYFELEAEGTYEIQVNRDPETGEFIVGIFPFTPPS